MGELGFARGRRDIGDVGFGRRGSGRLRAASAPRQACLLAPSSPLTTSPQRDDDSAEAHEQVEKAADVDELD